MSTLMTLHPLRQPCSPLL